jgi:glycosyltransferase involved in cell wall biosynthesis
MNLSVIGITYNEERNIGRCLASVKGIADEIIVVDSGSTDATETIAQSFGAVVYKRPWDDFASARNFGAGKAKHDLILTLDADEELSPELRRSIAEAKTLPEARAYRFIRLSNYCGKWIRHGGWYPDIKARIYDRKKTKWQGFVHAELEGIGRGDAELLAGECYHYSYYSIAEHVVKTKRYADLYARELFDRGKKSSFLNIVGNPVIKFLRDYLLRLGFCDGRSGLVIAGLAAYGTYLKYAALRRLHKEAHRTAPI